MKTHLAPTAERSGSFIGQRTEHEAEQTAAQEGLCAFFPRGNEVFLDIDDPVYEPRTKVLAALACGGSEASLIVTSSLVTTSKSGNKHVYLRFNCDLDVVERLVIQAALGSDPVKEALTLLRVNAGGTGAVALFETGVGADQVMAWRKYCDDLLCDDLLLLT